MHDSSTLRLNALVDGAMNSLAAKDLAVYDMLIDAILAHHSTQSNQRADDVSAFVVTRLSGALRSLWRRGWQPIDVVSVIRRLESNDHGEVVAAAVAWESWIDRDQPMHPSWVSQLEDLHLWFPHREAMQHDWIPLVSGVTQLSRRDIVEHAVAALVRLVRLPVLPVLIPPPGLGAASPVGDQRVANRGQHSYGSIDPKMLSRVRALLAKAESTEFAEEADAFTEKAQQLMARYSIDVAMVAAASAGASIGSTAVYSRIPTSCPLRLMNFIGFEGSLD